MREKIAEVPAPRVIVEVPRTLGQIGEVARLFSHEGVQQLEDEQLVDMPVPQILEDIVEVGSPLPQERRASQERVRSLNTLMRSQDL